MIEVLAGFSVSVAASLLCEESVKTAISAAALCCDCSSIKFFQNWLLNLHSTNCFATSAARFGDDKLSKFSKLTKRPQDIPQTLQLLSSLVALILVVEPLLTKEFLAESDACVVDISSPDFNGALGTQEIPSTVYADGVSYEDEDEDLYSLSEFFRDDVSLFWPSITISLSSGSLVGDPLETSFIMKSPLFVLFDE